jgi:hypothetical protein
MAYKAFTETLGVEYTLAIANHRPRTAHAAKHASADGVAF